MMLARVRLALWWIRVYLDLSMRDVALHRGSWIRAGRLGISFRRIPRFGRRFMRKKGERRGIEIVQFGPLVASWPRTAREAA